MKSISRKAAGVACLLLVLMLMVTSASSREEFSPPPFKYTGGTERLSPGCEGNLELTASGMTFRCPSGSVTAPFSSVILMQYRNDVSRKVWKMKIKWRVRPSYVNPIFGGKENRFFTVVFKEDRATRAMVLRVSPDIMRPYLAEIDLKAGQRVEVESHEEY